ncbi:hypothetical protein QYM36_011174, partial [Artemia franciscana]
FLARSICSKLILSDKDTKRVSTILLKEIENGLHKKTNKTADIKCYFRNSPNDK